ncbi:hypothetical protein KP509_39G035600 [Ceratopteris richardii]|uniref:SP-RING-type domain-containing protein n=2 Tax=Ceratopteris richardii TaxID=49495 RepID=A0A8T2Q066_CERRI|nr:hypothetical protein KP509_39G035600 [Ceratopteris richardii]KAH7277133.1 hypothetical protein KP509_39G035600 [Ceratopteris richardii]KAH7277134.1 hypothetical protein KP509_39G035600 [Ceratopteris richardii]
MMNPLLSARAYLERIYKCLKGNSKSDYREFTSTCISLARTIDLAVAKNQKPLIVQEIPQLLKKVCEHKDNEMFQPAIMVLLLSVKNAICFGWFSNAEGQELLRMSNELVDFFTGLGGWNPVDSSKASEIISKLMPKFYPLLTLQNVIVALEAKPGYEAMVCDFYVLKKPSPAEELRLFVIRTDNQETSACLVTPNHVNFLVNGKGVEKRSLTSMDVGPQMPSNVTSMLKIGTNLLQIVGDFPGNFLIAIALTSSKAEFSSPLDLQIFNHESMKTMTDEELVEGPSRVSLLCPISHKRITSPVKGVSCKHHQCFDYNSFMKINSRRPTWRCPYCNRNVSFPDLRLDLQMLKILKECVDTTVDVMVSEDGSWKVLNHEEAVTVNARVKDGESCRVGNNIMEEGEISQENNSSNYIELSDTEQQDREGQENTCSFPGVSGSSDKMEDRKPDLREISLAAAMPSMSGSQPLMETGREINLQTSTSELLSAVPQGTSLALPTAANALQSISEGLGERQQINREISRSPIAIQALPAQTGIVNPNLRVRVQAGSQPDAPAHSSSGNYSGVSTSQAVNQRPLQVQLPSFVGIQDGQVLLNTVQHQLQVDVPDPLISNQSLQGGGEVRDFRQRAAQHIHNQRTGSNQVFVNQPAAQPSPRVSRDHPYYPAVRNVNPVRTDRQTGHQASTQVRSDSGGSHDNNQFWQQLRPAQPTQQQPTQQQLPTHLNMSSSIAREELISPGIPNIADGLPIFNQSVISGSGNTSRRQSTQSPRTVSAPYFQALNNPLILPNTNFSPRDQRWTPLDGMAVHADQSNIHLSEQLQRPTARMRGSISNPVVRENGLGASISPSTTNAQWMLGGSSQPSRFSPGISLSGLSGDSSRLVDSHLSTNLVGSSLQSIQTTSTLVSDYETWFETLGDLGDVQRGLG